MEIRCTSCGGQGLVPHYSAEDFEGAKDCESCDGQGRLHVTNTGRLRVGEGGPFKGRLSAQELEELTQRQKRVTTDG